MTVKAFLYEPIKHLNQVYEVSVIFNPTENESLEWMDGFVNPIAVPIKRKISLLSDVKSIFLLTMLFYKHRFDAVHSVTPKAGLLAMLAAFVCRIPMRVHTFTGQVWATQSGFKRRFLKLFDWLIAKLATHVLTDSQSQNEFLIAEGVFSPGCASVLADGSISGVDVKKFSPDAASRTVIRDKLGLASDAVLILYLGRMNYDKGLCDLAKAFSVVENPEAHLLMVGPDEDNMRSELIELAGSSRDRVHFVGFSTEPEKFMAAADIFCLPSYREGFGSVIIEAAAIGVPAIGSNIYGICDAIESGYSGLLFSVKDVDALASQLNLLISDSKLREKLGKQARERAITKFNSAHVSRAWLDYYLLRL